jgi:Domain of unknown function (DUF5668)
MAATRGSQIAPGLVLIAVGLVFLAAKQHLIAPGYVGRLWPVVLLVLGFGRFMAKSADGKHLGGLTTILIGIIFLLHTFRVFTIDQSWPLFIVVGGVSLMVSSAYRDRQTGARS